jgi:uncharacterized membrane protein YeaQ/YmgE (transglycosylase-associated protein family)
MECSAQDCSSTEAGFTCGTRGAHGMRQFSNPATKIRNTADMTTILGWLIFGAIIGVLARFIMPGRDPMGWVMTILPGIAGSVVGGLLLGLVVGGRGTDPTGWIGSILGALLLLWLYRRYAGTRA